MTPRWSRSQVLASIAAATAAAAVDTEAAPKRPAGARAIDVAIIGAGLSGLVAARTLRQAGVERLVVLEARDRVGGRTVNHDLGAGYVAEGGGQWVGPTQTAILDLCRELGVSSFPTYLDGRVVIVSDGARFEAPYSAERTGPGTLSHRVDALAAEVPLDAPWLAQRAAQWDGMSLAQWASREGLSQDDRDSLARAAGITLGTTAEDLSLLDFLYHVRSAGGLRDLEGMRGGAQDSRIEGGSQILSLIMARELGDAVKLSSPVEGVRQDRDGVTIVSNGDAYRAKRAIIAMTPADCNRIAFAPALPAARRGLQSSWPRGGSVLKVNVAYAKPFWRVRGLSGLGVSDTVGAPLTVDNSPPDGSLGVILILTSGDSLPKNPASRRAAVLDGLAAMYGAEALDPVAFHEMDWGNETFAAPCVSGLGPGVLTRFGRALREPVGHLHWAGTEASGVWTGYMDGAVRAGQSAARSVLRSM